MEREKEIVKLVNVLRQTARTAQQAAWTGGSEAAAGQAVDQYNRVLGRLKEIDPGVEGVFQPLAAGSSLAVVAMACRQLAAYYADEVGASAGWGGVYGAAADPDAFKDFWRKSASEIEDFGDFIRENLDAWLCRGRRGGPSGGGDAPPGTPKDRPGDS